MSRWKNKREFLIWQIAEHKKNSELAKARGRHTLAEGYLDSAAHCEKWLEEEREKSLRSLVQNTADAKGDEQFDDDEPGETVSVGSKSDDFDYDD